MNSTFVNQIDLTEASISMKIKNTFLDVSGTTAAVCAPRRCCSAPSSPREKAERTMLFLERPRLVTKTLSKTHSSDASTLSLTGDSEEDAASTDMPEVSTTSTGGGVSAAASAPPPPPPPPPEPPAAVAAAASARTSLRSVLKAKAWTPTEGCDKDTFVAVEKVKQRLAADIRSLVDVTCEWQPACGAPSGCTFICNLSLMTAMEAYQSKEQVLTKVKQAFLTVAAEVPRICVMGQKRIPFVNTAQGFAVMLGVLEDPNHACWDAYLKGFCSRGTACQWHHPKVMTQVNINIVQVQTSTPEVYMAVPVAVPVEMVNSCMMDPAMADPYMMDPCMMDPCMMDGSYGSFAGQGYYPAEGYMMVDEFGNTMVAPDAAADEFGSTAVAQGFAQCGGYY